MLGLGLLMMTWSVGRSTKTQSGTESCSLLVSFVFEAFLEPVPPPPSGSLVVFSAMSVSLVSSPLSSSITLVVAWAFPAALSSVFLLARQRCKMSMWDSTNERMASTRVLGGQWHTTRHLMAGASPASTKENIRLIRSLVFSASDSLAIGLSAPSLGWRPMRKAILLVVGRVRSLSYRSKDACCTSSVITWTPGWYLKNLRSSSDVGFFVWLTSITPIKRPVGPTMSEMWLRVWSEQPSIITPLPGLMGK
mmetsp:Transcript_38073/g.80617  ORF Transcript_38073/g.80617 Transcript_38073/m.80617 type:complete len:250 (+) Transcript_38073:2077-2826(+)